MAKRILLVDDEKTFTMSLRRQLELSGYEIEETDKGSDVFRRLMQRSFDLVVLDYMMPDVRGNRVCENIRSEERFKDLPILVVTAYHDQGDLMVKSWGASEVLYKPVNTDDLIRTVKKYLGE